MAPRGARQARGGRDFQARLLRGRFRRTRPKPRAVKVSLQRPALVRGEVHPAAVLVHRVHAVDAPRAGGELGRRPAILADRREVHVRVPVALRDHHRVARRGVIASGRIAFFQNDWILRDVDPRVGVVVHALEHRGGVAREGRALARRRVDEDGRNLRLRAVLHAHEKRVTRHLGGRVVVRRRERSSRARVWEASQKGETFSRNVRVSRIRREPSRGALGALGAFVARALASFPRRQRGRPRHGREVLLALPPRARARPAVDVHPRHREELGVGNLGVGGAP